MKIQQKAAVVHSHGTKFKFIGDQRASGQSVGRSVGRRRNFKESVMVSASSVGRLRVIAPENRSEVLVCRRSQSIRKSCGGWSAVISQRSRWFRGQGGRWLCLLKRNDRRLSAITPAENCAAFFFKTKRNGLRAACRDSLHHNGLIALTMRCHGKASRSDACLFLRSIVRSAC